ncbi:hypothetical protein HYT02_04545 [Candidatus Gottesmanbacteria bacterium]|nr:hypothetical protein [Candidatus Gottesmanbacteria bacterium]
MLKDLIVSRVRVKILTLFFSYPGKIFHVREIVRKTSEEINAVRRELLHLDKVGLLYKEHRANRLYYGLRKDYPLYFELLTIITKTTGFGESILKNKVKLGKIKYAFISGRYARKKERTNRNEIDFLIVGNVVLPELTTLIKSEEVRVGSEINYTIMSEEEFEFRKKRRDPFVVEILGVTKVMLIGDEAELIS